ncbi:putative rna interference and silencing protein [Diplodia seriata]|uniref:Putative rna interference and silencing protein n=1 Tax=Diplodia seriata TaxID=420778 RepID=A0A0G2EJK2_9PEZI|nr:putative rna interference and silencing protein [Diplodia seriata]
MMKFALRGPAANANLIVNEGLVHLGIKDSTTTSGQSISKKLSLESIGFDIDDKLIDIDARILDSPKVQYSATDAINKGDPRKVLIEHGVKVMSKSPWRMTISPSPEKDGSYVASMKDAIAKVEKEMRNNGITMILLPQQDLDLYAALKTVCDAKGLPTICSAVNPNRLLNEQTLSNIALKFSLKTEGRPHQISGGLSHVTSDTMFMAVGSFDNFAVNYTGSMRLQKSRQEVIEDMNGMATELLNMYGRRNKKLPSSIVYYRDGVNEAQYDSIRQLEVMAIENAWMALKESGKPSTEPAVKITCMVVGKRHHTRFFPKRQYDADQSNNVKPGLVVDSGITHPYCFDFFLQSHAAVKGTARSAHYFLLRNDLKLGADELQKLTHDLCYTYGVATKGISYCAPAYLADKLCDRGRCYIRDWLLGRPSSSLSIPSYSKDLAPTVQDYERLLARRLSISKPFNNWETEEGGKYKGRKSPWHPSLDYKMFWV